MFHEDEIWAEGYLEEERQRRHESMLLDVDSYQPVRSDLRGALTVLHRAGTSVVLNVSTGDIHVPDRHGIYTLPAFTSRDRESTDVALASAVIRYREEMLEAARRSPSLYSALAHQTGSRYGLPVAVPWTRLLMAEIYGQSPDIMELIISVDSRDLQVMRNRFVLVGSRAWDMHREIYQSVELLAAEGTILMSERGARHRSVQIDRDPCEQAIDLASAWWEHFGDRFMQYLAWSCAQVRKDRAVLLLAGPPGAGKTQVFLFLQSALSFADVLPSVTEVANARFSPCLLYTSPSPRDRQKSRMPSSA